MNKWLFILLLPFMAFAQEVEVEPGIWKIPMNRFTGLNTIAGDRIIKPNEARIAHEIDFSRNGPGTISKRYGYDSVGTVTEVDSLVSIEAVQFNDGREYLVILGAAPDSNFGIIYVTNEGSDAMDSLAEGYRGFPVTKQMSVAKLDDKMYAISGVGRGAVWNGDQWRSWPLPAPGEPKIVPLTLDSNAVHDTTTWVLNGTYVYTFTTSSSVSADTAAFNAPGYVSTPVKIKNGHIMLTDFQWVGSDSLDTSRDSLRIDIYRSKGDYGRLEVSDSAWYLGYIFQSTSADAANYVFIDSIPDDSLNGATLPLVTLGSSQFIGRDDAGGYNHRYGAPGYISSVAGAISGDTTGIYAGWPTPEGGAGAIGIAYACTFIDTVNNVESGLGPPLVILQTNSIVSCTLSVPLPPSGQTGTRVNMYRSALRSLGHINKIKVITRSQDEIRNEGFLGCYKNGEVEWHHYGGFSDALSFVANDLARNGDCDSIRFIDYVYAGWEDQHISDSFHLEPGGWHLIAQLPDTQTIFGDTLTYYDCDKMTRYQSYGLPPLLESIFSYQRWLYGISGNTVYRSDVGNPNSWNIFEEVVDVGKGDGDRITAAWISRTALRVAKNYSTYNIQPSLFEDAELVSNWGCIAPSSVVSAPPGVFYLSADGVILETEGLYLERTYQSPLISSKLDNFGKLSMVSRKRAVGMWMRDLAQYWLCIGDTTYVYDWKASRDLGEPVWSTNSVAFSGGTSYDTDDELEFMPGRTPYFWSPYGGWTRYWDNGIQYLDTTNCDGACDSTESNIGKVNNRIETFGTSESDNGSGIGMTYYTGPLAWGEGLPQALRLGITATAQADNDRFLFYIYSPTAPVELLTVDSMTQAFRGYDFITEPQLYYSLYFWGYGGAGAYTLSGDTYVHQIDFYYMKNSEPYIWR